MKDATGKLGSWSMLLSSMKYTLKYRPGASNQNADALSRLVVAAIGEASLNGFKIAEEQANDRLCNRIRRYLEQGELDEYHAKHPEDWVHSIYLFKIHNGILLRTGPIIGSRNKGPCIQLVVPYNLRKRVLEMSHSDVRAGHFAYLRTYQKIRIGLE